MSEQIIAYENINHLEGIERLGEACARSGMFGDIQEPQGFIIALQCMAENKPPLELAKHYHIIKGKLTKRADAMLAEFESAGGEWQFLDLKNPTVQKAIVSYKKYEKVEVEYSVDDAKTCGVYNLKDRKGNPSMWAKFPANMLRARLVSETLRAIAPAIVTGVYTPEEAAQFDEVTKVSEPVKKATPANAQRKAEPKQAEVIETEIVDKTEREKLELIIDENKAEELINDFFVNKGFIDGKQTWRDLDEETQASMLSDFDQLLIAAREVQA